MKNSSSTAVAAAPSQLLLVPATLVTRWQREYGSFNEFVIRTFRSRYDQLLHAFQSLAFEKMDTRVLDYRRHSQKGNIVSISHRQLANELGTTRVVISRILKQFEGDKKIIISRGKVTLL